MTTRLTPQIDEEIAQLERDIDAVGRERVFASAQEHGWQPGSTPPIWVWRYIVAELRHAHTTGRKG
jgi:hypothetical protein